MKINAVRNNVFYRVRHQVGNHVEDQISHKIMEIEDAVTRNDFIWEVKYAMNLIL